MEYLNSISFVDRYEGESSSSTSVTPMYLNSLDHNYDQPPTPQRLYTFQERPLSYSSNLLFRIGATNTFDHPDFTTSSPPYNCFTLNSHNSKGIVFQDIQNGLHGFDAMFNIQDNAFHNTPHYNVNLAYLNGVRANDPTPRAFSVEFWWSVLDMIQDPSSLYHFACSRSGSKQLERLIKTLENCDILALNLTKALASNFFELAINSSGRQVIVQCFRDLGIRGKRVLSNKVVQHCHSLAINKSGCILLSACMPYMEAIYKDNLLSIIHDNAIFLAEDCYGTYVVQYAVSLEHLHFTPLIVKKLRCKFPNLSIQKEGSHLVEKCINSYLNKRIAVEAFLKLNRDKLQEIACNKFGNFVIQKALLSTMESPDFLDLHWRLQRALHPLVEVLRRNKFGKNVASKLYCARAED